MIEATSTESLSLSALSGTSRNWLSGAHDELQRLGLTVSHHAQRLHAAAVRGILHPADILHDAAGRDVRRLDDRREAIRLGKLVKLPHRPLVTIFGTFSL